MSRKLYVGNLAPDVTKESLRDAFALYGTVTSSVIVLDPDNGKPKGFGFVEMEVDAEADKANLAMNSKEFMGKFLIVRTAFSQKGR
jgi:RNA recognition motif-containing protein